MKRVIDRPTQDKQHNHELIKAEERQEMSRNVTVFMDTSVAHG